MRNEQPSPGAWSSTQRAAFRLVFAFWAATLAPTAWVISLALDPIQPWLADHVLHVVVPPWLINGSSDRTSDWVELFAQILFALLAAIAWSALDRKRQGYRTLDRWLRVVVRFNLGLTLCMYGSWKLFDYGGQFPPPSYHRLLTPVGALSPAALMWTFMGSSLTYKIFSGSAELLAGLLLFRLRTTMLGAALAVAVMSNVVVLNFAYDVGVKIYSTQLLLMAVFVLAPDLGRLADVFVLNRATQPREAEPLFKRATLGRTATTLATLFVAWQVGGDVWNAAHLKDTTFGAAVPLAGIYDVESMERNGRTVPPLLTDGTRWRLMTVERSGTVTVRFMDDSVRSFVSATDTVAKVFTVASPRAAIEPRFDWRYQLAKNVRDAASDTASATAGLRELFAYARPDPDHLVLSARRTGDSVVVHLRRVAESSLVLRSWPIHLAHDHPYSSTWIEAPYDGAPGDPRPGPARVLPLP